MKLSLKKFLRIEEMHANRSVEAQESITLPLPCLSFPKQDLSPLVRGMKITALEVGDSPVIPPLQLNLYTVENGTFFVGGRLDGNVLTEDNRPIFHLSVFSRLPEMIKQGEVELDLPEPQYFDEIFVGFDGSWRNYFHWMCLGLVKSFLAARHLDPSVAIALPEYDDALREGPVSYSKVAWSQSLEFSGLSKRVTLLPKGVYRAKKIHFFWTSSQAPTDLIFLKVFKDVFDRMLTHAIPMSKKFENVYLTRSNQVQSRLESTSSEVIARTLKRRGFKALSFDGIDLRQQISIIANAKRLASPHGAGLSNTLFHPGGLKVLEFNKILDAHEASLHFRPWFYSTSAVRNHRYATLDVDLPDFASWHVNSALSALDALDEPPPIGSFFSNFWTKRWR